MSQPTLSIIIVSWNVHTLLRACLTSIFANAGDLALEVIVVDNASADGSVAMVSAEFPQVTLLPQTTNIGFPKGNNVGMNAATGDYLFLLNPDTEIVADALQTMLAFMEAHTGIGLLGPQLFNSDGTHQSSRRRFPTLLTTIFESTWWQSFAPSPILNDYYVLDSADNHTAEVDWVSGAALLIRRSVFDQVGGMDANYYMYSEELDWCKRIKQVGWRVVYLPTAHIVHHSGKSSEQAVTHRHINYNRAKLRYVRKYYGFAAYTLLRTVLRLQFAQQIALETVKAVFGHKKELRQQRIDSYKAVLASNLTAAGFD